MRISDWSSDVCSSDLSYAGSACGHCGAGAHSAWSVGLERDAISFAEPASFRWRPARFVRPRHSERIARRKHQCRRVLSAEEERYAPFHGDTIPAEQRGAINDQERKRTNQNDTQKYATR